MYQCFSPADLSFKFSHWGKLGHKLRKERKSFSFVCSIQETSPLGSCQGHSDVQVVKNATFK